MVILWQCNKLRHWGHMKLVMKRVAWSCVNKKRNVAKRGAIDKRVKNKKEKKHHKQSLRSAAAAAASNAPHPIRPRPQKARKKNPPK